MNRITGEGGGVLKDLDFQYKGQKIRLGEKQKADLLTQLRRDVKVFSDNRRFSSDEHFSFWNVSK